MILRMGAAHGNEEPMACRLAVSRRRTPTLSRLKISKALGVACMALEKKL